MSDESKEYLKIGYFLTKIYHHVTVALMRQKARTKKEFVSCESLFAESTVEIKPESYPTSFAGTKGLLFSAF